MESKLGKWKWVLNGGLGNGKWKDLCWGLMCLKKFWCFNSLLLLSIKNAPFLFILSPKIAHRDIKSIVFRMYRRKYSQNAFLPSRILLFPLSRCMPLQCQSDCVNTTFIFLYNLLSMSVKAIHSRGKQLLITPFHGESVTS